MQHCYLTAHPLPANFPAQVYTSRGHSFPDPDCLCRCRQGADAPFLLESGLMNVHIPTVDDLANSLPSSWKDIDGALPNQAWLDQFWTMVASHQWQQVPPALTAFYLVPLVGGNFQTLRPQRVLTATHLSSLSLGSGSEQPAEAVSNTAAKVLTAVGCDCISEPHSQLHSSKRGANHACLGRCGPQAHAYTAAGISAAPRCQHLCNIFATFWPSWTSQKGTSLPGVC
jgi:hypothetical protein